MKNLLEGFQGRFEWAEETISKLGGRTMEGTESEEQKEKRWKKAKLRDLWAAIELTA